jgi:hypothetical protein
MITYETGDQKEVRRLRIAQFNGRTATVKSGEATVTGFVRSVRELESAIPQRWTVTIVPYVPREASKPRRSASRARSFVEDYL